MYRATTENGLKYYIIEAETGPSGTLLSKSEVENIAEFISDGNCVILGPDVETLKTLLSELGAEVEFVEKEGD